MHQNIHQRFIADIQAVLRDWPTPRPAWTVVDATAVRGSRFNVLRPPFLNKEGKESGLAIQVWNAWQLWRQEQEPEKSAQLATALANMKELIRHHQKPAGHLHDLTTETNLDTFTYDELVTLHALGAVAIHSNNAELLDAARRMAHYHLVNTQPDNTTDLPWAMAVFAWFPETFSLAQQQLHIVRACSNRSALMMALLADAALLLGTQVR